ncbi:amidohydrolase family protein (plasmid) [Pantoea sp. C3]|uniref:amidohydrolase family protein n=1 Tax=Pantoea phytostimulans TaxID=2769024 RepID=UPI0038F6399E
MKTSFLLIALMMSAVNMPFAAQLPGDILIKNGYIMPLKPGSKDLPDHDILIHEGQIAAVGTHLPAAGRKVINARGKFVLPGFVDTHSHLWVTTMRGQFRNRDGKFFPVSNQLGARMQPDDIYIAMYSGAVELLSGGITSSGDFFDNIKGPAWGDVGLKALKDSGIRAVMYYGGPDKTTKSPIDMDHLLSLAQQQKPDDRVKLGLGWRLPRELKDEQNWAMRQKEFRLAKQHNLPVQVHVSGDADAMFNALIKRNFLNSSLTVVHATDATQQQLIALKKSGGSLALTPISEQRVGYGLTRLDHFSTLTRKGLGIDGNALAGSGDMFATLRLAALTLSGATKDETQPDARQLLELATWHGADTLGLSAVTGSLEQGKRADIQIIDPDALNMSGFGGGDPAALILYSARPENVTTVIVDGHIIKQDGHMQNPDEGLLKRKANESARRLLSTSE